MNAVPAPILTRLALLAALAWGAPVRAQVPAAPAAPAATYKAVGLAGVGAVPEAVRTRVGQYLAQQFRLEVRPRGEFPGAVDSLAALARAKAPERQADEALLLLLVAGSPTNQPHGFLDVTNRVGVIHVDALRHADPEVEARRLERQALRSVSFFLGVPACPNPRCCLYPYANFQELDAIGRNTCPPCLGKFQAAAAKAGLTLTPAVLPEAIRKRLEEKRRKAAEGAPPAPTLPAPTPAQP